MDVSRPDGRGGFSHDDGWCNASPMSSEETPPLHFRLKPKIPLKLRSFISGLRAALRAVGLRNAPAGAVLSPPDPLRWAPAGAPPFLSAEKEKTLQRALSPLRGSPWRAVHGPKEKKTFWWLRKSSASIEGRLADLMRGRKDFLLFPRFAPGLARLGRTAALPPVDELSSPNGTE